MNRAGVFIGVDLTGNLPRLRDAANGAERMGEWAGAQNFKTISVITDKDGPVVVQRIKDAIEGIVDSGADQLVVYFAGHGVNIGYREYWLLTHAPRDKQAAVNVAGSVTLAQYCKIPHIVFISDACRTAAEGIQAQSVTGSEIFLDDYDGGPEYPVDQFFACTLGRPATEIKDPNASSAEYFALYTESLREALLGVRREILDVPREDPSIAYVRMRRLRDFLAKEVPERIRARGLQYRVNQLPSARIVSDEPAWISRMNADETALIGPSGRTLTAGTEAILQPVDKFKPLTPADVSSKLVRSALAGDAQALVRDLDEASASGVSGADELVQSARLSALPFGPDHHETGCGFKVRGARIVEVVSPNVTAGFTNARGDDVRVKATSASSGASVLLVFESGRGVLLPVLPEFLGALTFDEEELVDVSYEPSANTWRWSMYENRAEELRSLRAIVSTSIGRGLFQLEGEDSLAIARRMQYSKGIDPTLSIYAAYAYHDLQRRDLISEMSGYLSADLGRSLFDVAMLSRELSGRSPSVVSTVFSPIPLLSQGWALLPAMRVALAGDLSRLQQCIVPSVWTLVDEDGVAILREALQTGAIK